MTTLSDSLSGNSLDSSSSSLAQSGLGPASTRSIDRRLRAYAEGDEQAIDEVICKLEQRLQQIAQWELRRFPTVKKFEGEGTHAVRSVINAGLARLVDEMRLRRQLLDKHGFTQRVRQKIHDHLVDVHRYLFGRKSRLVPDTLEKPTQGMRAPDVVLGRARVLGEIGGSLAEEIHTAAIDRREAPMMGVMLVCDLESIIGGWPRVLQDTYHWLLEYGDPRRVPAAIAQSEGVSIKIARRRVREVQSRIGKYLRSHQE